MTDKSYILVVDDEDTIREVVRRYLEHEGYVVREAADGYEALDFIQDTLNGPMASLGVYAQWEVWKEAHLQNYDTILSGNGPDELLAGYLPYFGSYLKTLLLQGNYSTALSAYILYFRK